jgi:hypothetical protein
MLPLLRVTRKLAKMGRDRRRLLFQAAILSVTTRLLLRPLSLTSLGRFLDRLAKRIVPAACSEEEDEIVRALSAVNRRLGGTCLTNALAAQALLARYGYPATLRIGASRQDGGFSAHAWVERNGQVVIGGPASVVAQYSPFPHLDGLSS